MDFGSLLHTAQKIDRTSKKEPIRCYSTKFEPPKKEQRNKQQLSENIKKFLAKKEAEERQKLEEKAKKRDELLALRARDKKSTRRVNVMLKRTKSANQSVIQDAVDSNNTSVTLAGPIQPDEDDYGYVSQEAAAYYNKMMEKYSKMPDEPKFNTAKKKVSNNLTSTKDRVRAALEKEKEEANMPHKRKRKVKENESDDFINDEEEMIKKPATKPKYKAPPPLNFNELLKLAEKKQFEPIVIETKPKEEERLLTKKQKKELEIERESKKRREQRNRDDALNKIPRLGEVKTVPQNLKKIDVNSPKAKSPVKSQIEKNVSTKVEITKKQINAKIPEVKKSHEVLPASIKYTPTPISKLKELNKPKYEPTKKIVSQQQENKVKIAPKDIKPKQFPPSDVRRNDLPPAGVKRKPPLLMKKGRILDEEDEEYDSEMDDFIDDGPEEDGDYSKYISEIFGYDKSKYRNADEDVDNMESTFAQQMREECISTKIGIMEDLEDMKMEEEEKRRKALMKKKNR